MSFNSTGGYPPGFPWSLTSDESLIVIWIVTAVTGAMILTAVILYVVRWVRYMNGKSGTKRVYYSWKHGNERVAILRSREYVQLATVAIERLSANGEIPRHTLYETESFGSPFKTFHYCLCCCFRLGAFQSVRSHDAVFRELPGYPEFNPGDVHKLTIVKQCNTNIDL